ncbi:hypothetical protein D9M68_692970 [compost metagenome]
MMKWAAKVCRRTWLDWPLGGLIEVSNSTLWKWRFLGRSGRCRRWRLWALEQLEHGYSGSEVGADLFLFRVEPFRVEPLPLSPFPCPFPYPFEPLCIGSLPCAVPASMRQADVPIQSGGRMHRLSSLLPARGLLRIWMSSAVRDGLEQSHQPAHRAPAKQQERADEKHGSNVD